MSVEPTTDVALKLLVSTATLNRPETTPMMTVRDLRGLLARLAAAEADKRELVEGLRNFENDDGRVPPAIWKIRNDLIAKHTPPAGATP